MPDDFKSGVYGRAHVYSTSELYEVQHTNHFEVVIPGMQDMLGEEYDVAMANSDESLIKYAVKSISMPEISLSSDEIKKYNTPIKVPHSPSIGETTIVFNDMIGVDVERILFAWFRKVYDPEKETVGYTNDYKLNIFVMQFSGDGSYLRAWKLCNCAPISFSIPDFEYDSGSLKTITVRFSVDNAYIVPKEEIMYIASSYSLNNDVENVGGQGIGKTVASGENYINKAKTFKEKIDEGIAKYKENVDKLKDKIATANEYVQFAKDRANYYKDMAEGYRSEARQVITDTTAELVQGARDVYTEAEALKATVEQTVDVNAVSPQNMASLTAADTSALTGSVRQTLSQIPTERDVAKLTIPGV